MSIFGSLISGGANLIGGLLGRDTQNATNDIAVRQAAQNRRDQYDFAQNAIQWKVADAEKAGIHPLYALGANPTSFNPVSVGLSSENHLGRGLSAMGQDISRAVAAPRSPADKVNGVAVAQQTQSNALSIENQQIQNQILRVRLALMTQPGTPPGVPFEVPEKNKPEERPPLMIGGRRWDTNPDTSPMKAWEDQYGDEGPVSWSMPIAIGWNDLKQNFGHPNTWPAQIGRWGANAVWNDAKTEYGNARRFVRRHVRGVIGP